MSTVGYIPFQVQARNLEPLWLADELGCEVRVLRDAASLNVAPEHLPARRAVETAVEPLLSLPHVVVEGPGGFLWAAALRLRGYRGAVTALPYINPCRWFDLLRVATYLPCADPRDRVHLGSEPSAAVYGALGVPALVGEPFGVDCTLFRPVEHAGQVLDALGIPPGPLLLFAGRAQADKDLYRLLRVGLKARVLFPDLQLVIAAHVADEAYLELARRTVSAERGVHFVRPTREQLAALYSTADLFISAATSHHETFGRAPAEALCCGTRVVVPRYDGFASVADQPGGALADVLCRGGQVHVDEHAMLRAVFAQLSATEPTPAEHIARIARARFSRAHTIQRLRYLLEGSPGPAPVQPLPAVDLALPQAWTDALADMEQLAPAQAWERFWTTASQGELHRWDPQHEAVVRRLLCELVRPPTYGSVPCP